MYLLVNNDNTKCMHLYFMELLYLMEPEEFPEELDNLNDLYTIEFERVVNTCRFELGAACLITLIQMCLLKADFRNRSAFMEVLSEAIKEIGDMHFEDFEDYMEFKLKDQE